VHVLLWAAALPAYFAARDGVTATGTPIGCGLYALACIVAAALIVAITARATSLRDVGKSGPALAGPV
jgi:hypothetical protein